MGESAQSHPFALHWLHAKSIVALKFSDFPLTVRQRFLSRNWDIHQDLGREHLTIPVSFSAGGTHAVSVRRDRRWFTEEDRLVMNVLAPHLRQAHANALSFERATAQDSLSTLATEVALTMRESEVAHWLAQGKTNREIGLILNSSGRTVDKHVEHLLKKLRVENRTTAALSIANTLRGQTHSTAES
jgi:DNA-binding CsgD family transcriptional regulator